MLNMCASLLRLSSTHGYSQSHDVLQGPDVSGSKRVHPAALAHAARIARAQQQGLTFYGFKARLFVCVTLLDLVTMLAIAWPVWQCCCAAVG